MADSKVVVTGGAGFIGSHAARALAAAGKEVVVVDNLSSGHLANVESLGVSVVQADAADADAMASALDGAQTVWHAAANPEVRVGQTDPGAHYDANVHLTFRVLEAMRHAGVGRICFTSTSTVYGEAAVVPTPEDYGPMLPISVYGGCKLACEALISAYAGTFGMDALLFRFANVVGPHSNHGVTYDFVRKLGADPTRLEILGDGTQTKSYVHVEDVVAGMLWAADHAPPGCHPYNIGSRDAIPVTQIADIVADVLGASPEYIFTGAARQGGGWVGDVKDMRLAIDKMQALGWQPQNDSAQSIQAAATWLRDDA